MLNEKQIIIKKRDCLKQRRLLKKRAKSMSKRLHRKDILKGMSLALQIVHLDVRIATYKEILKGNKIDFKQLKNAKPHKSILQEIRQIKPLVIHLLKTEPDTRDDDNLLCCRVWENQGVIPNMKMATFKKRYILHQYAMSDSITRCRRGLQRKYKSLRGKLYDERHKAEIQFSKQYKLPLYGA